mmetsp:Transcript_135481/g.420899  ORF Transcript_135481/g.420899 Transcript_135481/m.420899 type:complete len:375 (-) Transcript_135481:10-1134(-)
MAPPPPVHPSVQGLKQQGDRSYESRDYAGAIERYSEALESVDDAVVLSNRSATYAQRRRFDKALVDADRALKLKPDWPRLHHRRGFALFHCGRYGEAIASFERGLRLDPADKTLQDALAKAQKYAEPIPGAAPMRPKRAGGFSAQTSRLASEAPAAPKPAPAPEPTPRPTGPKARYVVVHDKVVERQTPSTTASPKKIWVRDSVVEGVPCSVGGVPWLQLDAGWMLMDGKSVGLGQLLKPEVRSKADELREQGNAFFREQKYSKAIWTYTEAIEEEPRDARLYSNRAAAQMGQLQILYKAMPGSVISDNSYFKEALADLDKAIEIDPRYIKAWARKGQLWVMADDKTQARAAYEEGLKVDPGNAECRAGCDACR